MLYHLSVSVTCDWGGGAHLGAAVLSCCVRCPSHFARGIEHLCHSNYNRNSPGDDRAIVWNDSPVFLGLALDTWANLFRVGGN